MVLGFMTKFPDGTPTNFIQKIFEEEKIHTIRRGERWKAGMTIHMATGVRTKDYLQFNKGHTSLLKCVSVQDIAIKKEGRVFTVTVDINERGLRVQEIHTLAKNDGLTYDQLVNWFAHEAENGGFEGQIIHWTSYRY